LGPANRLHPNGRPGVEREIKLSMVTGTIGDRDKENDMDEKVWFRSHVERLLEMVWGIDEVVRAPDGMYYGEAGSAVAYVSVETDVPMAVRIMVVAAEGVPGTAKVLRELNEINACSRFGWVSWWGGAVHCEAAIPADGLTPDNLAGLWGAMVSRANHVGPMLAAVHGGHVPYDLDEMADDEEVA
jgi:hypothetical protein